MKQRIYITGIRFALIAVCLCVVIWNTGVTHARTLTKVTDLIGTSAPATTTSHTLTFTLTGAVPAGGQIAVSFMDEGTIVPTLFDIASIDLSYATSGGVSFIDRDLDTARGTSTDGVTITSGLDGGVVFSLNTTEGFAAGDTVRVELGSVATYGGTGGMDLISSATTGPYRVKIETRDTAGNVIDWVYAMYFLIEQVSVGPVDTRDDTPPVRFNPLPTGILPGGTQAVLISLETDQLAHCRYATTTGVAYASSTNDFDQIYDFFQSKVITVADNTEYFFYVRCTDPQGNVNTDDFTIHFEIGADPNSASGTAPYNPAPPRSGGGGGGAGPKLGPGPGPFLDMASLTIEGRAYPGSTITILRDGVKEENKKVSDDGSFSYRIDGLERGTYTFGIYAVDRDGVRSATYSSTVSLVSGTDSLLSPVFIPPTINVASDTIDPGGDITFYGYGVPGSELGVIINRQGNVLETDIHLATTSVSAAGEWNLVFNTAQLSRDTYLAKAYTKSPGFDASDFSPVVYIGIGGAPEPDFSLRADLNKDGYVNLVDFSILLFNWGTADDVADINMDGIVDLTDFSIMIFFWTG